VIDRLVVLGLGDVTKRYLLPALAQLSEAGELPEAFRMTGVSREDHSTEWLREQATEALRAHAGEVASSSQAKVIDALDYHRADATDPSSFAGLFDEGRPVVIYLALPPAVHAGAIRGVAEAGAPQGSRLVVEKPFGADAESAEELNELAHRSFAENDVFRVDHFLGIQTAHNIVAVRFANRLFEAVWGYGHVERVEVVWDEVLAMEGRGASYDGVGAARDMLQNHLLQLACLVAMEPPESLERDGLADRKVEVLRSMRPWTDDIADCSVRARYTAGEIDSTKVPAYTDEEGVDPDTGTETFAEITVAVGTPRWAGVPFTLRSGKALAENRHEVAIHFNECERVPFSSHDAGGSTPSPNVVRLSVDPDQLTVDLRLSVRGGPDEVSNRQLVHDLPAAPLGPYALLIREALTGDVGYSVRDDEAVAAWQVIDPFLQAWGDDAVPLEEYSAGSTGP
jgi:glucose-6-phosphate 1-dehydrogenase